MIFNRQRLNRFGFLLLPVALLALSSCLNGDDTATKYKEWYEANTKYINDCEAETNGAQRVYEKIVPAWDPSSYTLVKWIERGQTGNLLTPLSNSTVDVKYMLTNISGDTIDSSYSQTQYGDSIFRCRPNEMITGFWIAVTSMHVGDSVTAVIPFQSGYGMDGSNSIPPFSTLIFQIKLENIVAFDSEP